MKKISKKTLLYAGLGVAVLSILFYIGCGQANSGSGAQTTGSIMQGVMENAVSAGSLSAKGVKALTWPPGSWVCNPNYPVVITTPESYAVGLWKVRLCKVNTNDATAYLITEYAAVGDEPEYFLLSGTPQSMGSNAEYPAAGTYDVFVPTLAYLEQTIPAGQMDFEGVNKFRVQMATYGKYHKGDVLVYKNSAWNWIATSESGATLAPVSGARPSSLMMVNWGNEYGDPFEPTDVSFEAVYITDDPTGVYTFTLVFDVASTFAFNDLNQNGIFEPGVEYPEGDEPSQEARNMHGPADWNIGPPNLSITVAH